VSDKLFAACCLGSEAQHAVWDVCSQDLAARIVVEAEAILALTKDIDARRKTLAADMAGHIDRMTALAAWFARSTPPAISDERGLS
jgi:hypothetical protein